MGTVLSFSPREQQRRPIYSSTHHHHHNHRGSGTISSSNSASDFQLNNYAYEQINNVKNRENIKPPMQYLSVPNQFQLQNGSAGGVGGSVVVLGSNGSNVATTMDERQADSARILSEKNAIEKNLKKHSLFINALSWKRLSSSHGKKKLESNNAKNKASNVSSGGFRPPTLTDTVHPMMVVNDKKKYPQQQVQLIASNNSSNNNVVTSSQPLPSYFNGDTKNLLSLDLQNANNIHTYQNIDMIASKVSIPIRPVQLSTSNGIENQQYNAAAPRKTIIQVSHNLIAYTPHTWSWTL